MSNSVNISDLQQRKEKAKDFPTMLQLYKSQVAAALPKHINPDRMCRIALTCYRMTPLLAKCTPESVFAAIVQAAQLGLEPGLNGQAYLVPYWNNKKSAYECQLIPGYRGLITLARNTGQIESVTVQIVYSNDTADLALGTNEHITHKPALTGDRGDPLWLYCICNFKDGGRAIELMTWSQIMKIRERTKSRDKQGNITGPWVTDIEEMARKTLVRRASKYWPMSVELATANALDDAAARGAAQNIDIKDAIAGEYVPVSDDDDAQQGSQQAQAALPEAAGGEPLPPQAMPQTQAEPAQQARAAAPTPTRRGPAAGANMD